MVDNEFKTDLSWNSTKQNVCKSAGGRARYLGKHSKDYDDDASRVQNVSGRDSQNIVFNLIV